MIPYFFLPWLMSRFTGPRYLPDIEWSNKSWTHNLFRVYEMIFWREAVYNPDGTVVAKIRPEEITIAQFNHGRLIKITHVIRSFEAFCAFIETYIRDLLKFKFYSPVKIYIPQLAALDIAPSPFLLAIALDATTASRTDGPGNTYAKTCTGSNLILFIGNQEGNGGDHVTTVTYHLDVVTQDANSPMNGTTAAGDFWMQVNPATGSNNVINTGNTSFLWSVAASYSGAKQTGQPDSSAKSVDSTTIATTVVASNCWLAGVAGNEADGGIAAAPSSSRTDRNSIRDIRNNGLFQFGGVFFDSNATVGTGSQSTTLTGTGGRWANAVASFAPTAAATVTSNLPLIGVG